MKKEFKNHFKVIFLFAIIFFSIFIIDNLAALAAVGLEAPTVVGAVYDDNVINYQEEYQGFGIIVNLVGSGAEIGDRIELCYAEGSFDIPFVEILNSTSTHTFAINSGLFLNQGTSSVAIAINNGADNPCDVAATSPFSDVFLDTIGPNIGIIAPVFGDTVNAQSVIDFIEDGLNFQCSVDNLNWHDCVSGESTLGDIHEFGDLDDGMFALYLSAVDENGNMATATSQDIIKDATGPVGIIVSTNDGYITDQQLYAEIKITYDEPMDLSSSPLITFGETTGVFSARDEGAWSKDDEDNDVWMQIFDITDGNELREDVVINSTGASDMVGNLEGENVTGLMDIDTKNPRAVITTSVNLIHQDSLSQMVTLTYDEEMDTEMEPVIYFNESFYWSEQSGGWLSDRIYSAVFIHDGSAEDVDDEFAYIDSSTAITDINGNDELGAESATFEIDTIHPQRSQGSSCFVCNNKIEEKIEIEKIEIRVPEVYDDVNGRGGDIGEGFFITEREKALGEKIDQDKKNIFDKYVKKIIHNQKITKSNVDLITDFVYSGVTGMKNIGYGERAAVLEAYKNVFGKLPMTRGEWGDVVKMANGEMLNERNIKAENSSKKIFAKIYKREYDKNKRKDERALNLITYGLRIVNRNIASEHLAIRKFDKIYKRKPASVLDWNIIRSFAYAGI